MVSWVHAPPGRRLHETDARLAPGPARPGGGGGPRRMASRRGRRRARCTPAAGREARRHDRVPPLGDPAAGLGHDDTGVRPQGRRSAGGARPSRGTAGPGDPGPIGVWLGHARVARERSRPEAWTDDRERGPHAGIPADRPGATTPPRAGPRRAGTGWTMARGCAAATGDGGREDEAGRRGTAWSRPLTRARWTLALLTGRRAGGLAGAACKNRRRGPQLGHRLAA